MEQLSQIFHSRSLLYMIIYVYVKDFFCSSTCPSALGMLTNTPSIQNIASYAFQMASLFLFLSFLFTVLQQFDSRSRTRSALTKQTSFTVERRPLKYNNWIQKKGPFGSCFPTRCIPRRGPSGVHFTRGTLCFYKPFEWPSCLLVFPGDGWYLAGRRGIRHMAL